MNKNFEKIFLGLLWLMMVSLAITFWMSVKYGFNIFSGAHWAYLSSLQANRAQIKPGFYTSLIVALGIALIGLYFLARPHFRKIKFNKPQDNTNNQQNYTATSSLNNGQTRPASPLAGQIKKDAPKQTYSTAQTTPTSSKMPEQSNSNPLHDEISDIFDSAGYIMKPCKKIAKMNSPVVALAYNETLWIGASNISPNVMMDAIGNIMAIFDETLGDSANDMTIRGCIIAPSDTDNPNPEVITLFENIDKFKEFMENNKNTLPPEHDAELFEAISTYISTVVSHIGKQ